MFGSAWKTIVSISRQERSENLEERKKQMDACNKEYIEINKKRDNFNNIRK